MWTRLGFLFGGLIGTSILVFGLWSLESDLQQERVRLQKEMEAVAAALAAGIDGDSFDSFVAERDRERPSFQAIVRQLHSVVETASSVTWAGTCRRDDRGRWTWVVEHTNENAYPVGFPIFDAEAARNEAIEGALVYRAVVEDESGRWRTVWAPIRSSTGTVVGLIEVGADADRDLLIAADRRRRVYGFVGVAMLLSLAVSFVVGRWLSGNLMTLVSAAQSIAKGDLGVHVDVRSSDEVGVLAESFNHMVEGLKEREFIRDTFGRFVNPDVVAGILADRDVRLGGEVREVTVLMSDLRGFTALSAELGPERMVALLNRYLSRMTEVVVEHGGNVAELLGDGMVILFGAPVTQDDDPQRALRCAMAMQMALADFNVEEDRALEMGIGIHTGSVIAGNIGSSQHMKYGVVGAAINLASRLEAYTVGNQVLVSKAATDKVANAVLGAEVRFQPKGHAEEMVCYPILAIDGIRAFETADTLLPVALTARVWRLSNKSIDMDSVEISVVALGHTSLVIEGLALELRAKVKLDLRLADGTELRDVYGTVENLEPMQLHLSGLSQQARRVLESELEPT